MPSLSHLLLNFLELRPHAVASGFPFHLELSAAACSADEGETQKIEGLRFSEPPMSAALHCEAAELDQTGFLRMECQRELPQSVAHRFLEAADICVELKPDDKVIGISHDNHVPHRLTMSPSLGPEIKRRKAIRLGSRMAFSRWEHFPVPVV